MAVNDCGKEIDCHYYKSDEGAHYFVNEERNIQYALPHSLVALDNLPAIIHAEEGVLRLLPSPCETAVTLGLREPDSVTSSPLETTPQWTDEATKKLIVLYEEKIKDVRGRKFRTMKQMWEEIVEILGTLGYLFTAKQVEMKWHTLERAYKRVIDNAGKTGRGRKSCPFQSELERVLGANPNIRPDVLVGQSGFVLKSNSPEVSCSHLSPPDRRSESCKQRPIEGSDTELPYQSTPKRKRMSNHSEQMAQALEFSRSAEEKRQKRHEDKMGKMDELIAAVNNLTKSRTENNNNQ